MPENCRRHATHAKRTELHGLAGRIDLADLCLAEPLGLTKLRKLAAGATRAGRAGKQEKRNQQKADCHHVSHFAGKSPLWIHRATSRFLKKRYPIMNSGTKKASAVNVRVRMKSGGILKPLATNPAQPNSSNGGRIMLMTVMAG